MSSFLHKNVLITGGASGIGRLLAEKILDAGTGNLIIWDNDTDSLSLAVDQFTTSGHSVHAYVVDLADRRQVEEAAELVLNEIGPVDILFNNAGVVVGGVFAEYAHEEIERVIRVNTLGVMHTTRAFLPDMIERDTGHIVNIASAAGLLANPKMTVYVGSKWAVTGWSESLRLELESTGSTIRVTTIQPGFIRTGLFEGVKAPLFVPILDTEYITEKIISAVRNNKIQLREPFMIKLIPFLKGILPAKIFDFLAGKLFKVYRSMDTFKKNKQEDL